MKWAKKEKSWPSVTCGKTGLRFCIATGDIPALRLISLPKKTIYYI
jgi:hypothetical protein